MLKYIPSNLDIDKLLSDVPPTFKYSRDCFVYILGLITEIPANIKGLLDKNTYVPINATILKQHVHNYRLYLDYLLQNCVFETDNRYIPEEKSKGYRFTAVYQTPVQPVEITKYTLIKGLQKEGNYERGMLVKYRWLTQQFNKLQFDYDGALHWLGEQYKIDVAAGLPGAMAKYNANLLNAVRLKNADYYFRIDKVAGRAHHNLTSLKSELRGFLSCDGNHLVSNDLVAAHPTLLLALLNERFYDKAAPKDTFTLHNLAPKLAKTLDIERVKKLIRNGQQDIAKYTAAIEGDIYVFMQGELSAKGYLVADRKAAKEIMYAVLYSNNRFYNSPEALPKRLFAEVLFPEVYKICCAFKRKEANALAVFMMKLEATLMLDRIARRIGKEKPKTTLFTIHDSLLSRPEDAEYCKTVMKEETFKIIGKEPKIKQEISLPPETTLTAPETTQLESPGIA